MRELNRQDLESALLDFSPHSLPESMRQTNSGRAPITTYIRLAGVTILLGSIYALAAGYFTSNKSMLIWGLIGTIPGVHLTFFPRGYGLFKR